MTRNVNVFPLIVFLLTATSSNAFSQKEKSQVISDTVKTVAIYSSKKSFFKDYPVDTLVLHLNSLNTNPKVNYYKSTEDRSKTGFYADYLIDLDVWIKMATLAAPKWETIEHSGSKVVQVRQQDGTFKALTQNITTKDVVQVNATVQPAEGEIKIKIIEKSKNEKVTSRTLNAKNQKEQDLKFVLIISLIEFMLGHFY